MMYPLITMSDGSEIVYSEMMNGRVKVYIEKPDEKDCFHNATCWLPEYKWENINGFSKDEIDEFQKIIKASETTILDSEKII